MVKARDKFIAEGRKPNTLFLNAASRERLAQQAGAAYNVDPQSVRKVLLDMEIYVSKQYKDDQFRIYCAPLEVAP